ncbi:peptide/nickel transport system substrate-binding protein [Friedmanniella endophytica]|uniref:Peptide/nickel transport system substrate-binding protein n=1 Tax=Microlunatus kandeliicorticis TaxID=1759536 RepID=A0A7W3P5B5_9ACTN|nr:ABC transporter substrate-binding protein [Microlunatus kandeliicorticis]MBA8793692.1 peptide/nickel transport system substrate-binding protein [Microlunatus kandeliicorticis]
MGLRRTLVAVIAVLTSLTLLTTGCAGSRLAHEREARRNHSGGTGGMIPQLNLPAEFDASVGGLVNYNPYAPQQLVKTWLYEPLMVQDSLSCGVTPWLATKYTWVGSNKLIFDIRQGVKWSDGSAFTPNDVVTTLNLMKKYPAMDVNGLWTSAFGAPATSVTAQGDQVIITFAGPAVSKFSSILGNLIVPAKIYGKVGDPTKYVDKKPVSTGPFLVGSYNGRRLELDRNPDYWQADKIKVQKLVLQGNYDANQAVQMLRNGDLDFYTGEIPNPIKTFVDPNPQLNHVWYAPNGSTVLAPNLTRKPFSDVRFREAMAYGVNKQQASLKATYGLMQVASQSGLTLPAKKDLLPPGYALNGGASTILAYDPAKANQLLDAAGYTKGPDGFRRNPDGSPIKLTFAVQAGFIDYQAVADEVVSNLRALGIDISVVASQPDSVDALKKTGDFDIMINYMAAGCDYVNGVGATLATAQIPTKTTILGNVERYSNPTVDQALKNLNGETDQAKVKDEVGVLVNTMMTQYPVVPLFYAPARAIYRTDKAAGWPSAEDPYCNPQDNARIWMTRLSAAK